jgi:O-antigen/teichoic acid export membrane protein
MVVNTIDYNMLKFLKSWRFIKDELKNPLYKNSFFITSARFFNVFIGFIFWIVAARLYSIEDVGIGTALISSMAIIISISRLGFDFTLIRFVNKTDKKKVFNTSNVITTLASIIIGIIYISGLKLFSSSLIKDDIIVIFLIFVMASSLASIMGIEFTAIRKSDNFLIQNIIFGSRAFFLIPLTFLGGYGIFDSVGIAFILSALFSLIYLNKFVRLDFKADRQFMKDSLIFSSGNYATSMFSTIPPLIIPLMVFGLVGDVAAAKYYMAFAVGSTILIIPDSLSTSLFIEGSHGENLRKNVIKVCLTIYSLLIPAVIFLIIFSDYILSFFGKNYTGTGLLKLFALSSLLYPLVPIYTSIQNVRMKVKSVVKMNFAIFSLLICLSYILLSRFGIIGIGYAWIIGYGILDIMILILIKKSGWI